jgi:hypothetical protein
MAGILRTIKESIPRPELKKYKDELALQLFGKTLADAHNEHICIRCKNPQGEFRDEQSQKEYNISGLCQTCQDEIFETGGHDGTTSI